MHNNMRWARKLALFTLDKFKKIGRYLDNLQFSLQPDSLVSPNTNLQIVVVIIILFSLTIAMVADVLFTDQPIVLSKLGTDLSFQFIFWRQFGFEQLKHGNLALWNPHVFSGTPFLGMFQAAIFYPLNLIYLFIPLQKAVNWDITLNIFLAGLFTYLWTSHRRLHPLACLLASILQMFGSTRFLHIYSGHLDALATMTWTPLIFLAIDGMLDTDSWNWWFLGIFGVAMQIVAGHPQYLFFTAVAVVIYVGLNLIHSKKRFRILGQLCTIYAGGVVITAIQFLTGIQMAEESIRSGGASYTIASTYSFPPENFITLLAPKFFGNDNSIPYWGRYNLWEMALFIGVTGFFLMLYGVIYGKKEQRRFSLIMTIILLLFALGRNTPFYHILYTWVPGLDRFRGPSKFIYPASLYMTLLAGIGLDLLLKRKQVHKNFILGVLASAVLLCIVGLFIQISALNDSFPLWQHWLNLIKTTRESFFPTTVYQNQSFITTSGIYAGNTLLIAAGMSFLFTLLLLLRKYSSWSVILIGGMAITEIFVFARGTRPTYTLSKHMPILEKLKQDERGDFRILNMLEPNSATAVALYDIWGFQPLISKRYAEFIDFTQGQRSPEIINSDSIHLTKISRLFSMLRCRFVFISDGKEIRIIELQHILPRAVLIHKYQVIRDRDTIFSVMAKPEFDPNETVILEKPPNILTMESSSPANIELANRIEKVRIKDISTDQFILEADLTRSAILVITDGYSKGWQVKSLIDSPQHNYEIIPANYVLRAIPLTQGHHRILVEYSPWGFRIGKWISLVSILCYLILFGLYYVTKNQRRPMQPPPNAEQIN